MAPQYLEPELDPEFPSNVKIAGIIWIVNGGIIFLDMLILLAAVFVLASGPRGGDVLLGGIGETLVMLLFGGVFLHVGIDSLRGKAKDTLGNGIGSLAFGIIAVIGLVRQALAGSWIQAGVALICAIGLFTAGILALLGRADYKAWRQHQKSLLPPAAGPRK